MCRGGGHGGRREGGKEAEVDNIHSISLGSTWRLNLGLHNGRGSALLSITSVDTLTGDEVVMEVARQESVQLLASIRFPVMPSVFYGFFHNSVRTFVSCRHFYSPAILYRFFWSLRMYGWYAPRTL